MLAALAVDRTILLREVLGMRFDQLSRAVHSLACLEGLVVLCGLFGSLDLFGTVRPSSLLLMQLWI